MFTGLINDMGDILSAKPQDGGSRLRIACGYPLESLKAGASMACAGICLTLAEIGNTNVRNWFEVEASAETLAKTTLGNWKAGDRINLERPLKAGDEMGGHIVTGHVDGIARIISRTDESEFSRLVFLAPVKLGKFIAPKGSVALDGTSLTVNGVNNDEFDVMLIPHTLKVTTWGQRKAGDLVNIEVDLMARYAARLLESQPGAGQ